MTFKSKNMYVLLHIITESADIFIRSLKETNVKTS